MPSEESDKQAVARLVHRIYNSYQQFDPDLLNQCDTPECTLWDLFEPDLVQGGSAARAEFRKKDMSDSKKRGPLTINVEEPVVDVWVILAWRVIISITHSSHPVRLQVACELQQSRVASTVSGGGCTITRAQCRPEGRR